MQKDNNKIKESYKTSSLSPTKQIISNPIDKSGLIAKINVLGSGINPSKVSNVINSSHHNDKFYGAIDYIGFIKETNEILKNHKALKDTLNAFHNMFVNRLNCAYTALGIINEQSTTINIKLLDKNSNVYSFRVFMNDDDNEIIKAIKTGEITVLNDSSFLKVPSLVNIPSVIIPIQLKGRNICVAMASDYNIHNHINMYQMASMSLGLIVENSKLLEKVAQSSYMDSLTNLYSHRRFHELLTQELAYADSSKTKVSILIFDINNMGQINKDYGHSKGDEVIKIVANKINETLGINFLESKITYRLIDKEIKIKRLIHFLVVWLMILVL